MTNLEIQPPWLKYPKFSPSDIFWRQTGESWALYVWLPFWTSLSSEQREQLLIRYEAPKEWKEFYTQEHQEWLANIDGPAGWLLRNNLTPCSEDKLHYISVNKPSRWHSFKWPLLNLLGAILLVAVCKYYGIL